MVLGQWKRTQVRPPRSRARARTPSGVSAASGAQELGEDEVGPIGGDDGVGGNGVVGDPLKGALAVSGGDGVDADLAAGLGGAPELGPASGVDDLGGFVVEEPASDVDASVGAAVVAGGAEEDAQAVAPGEAAVGLGRAVPEGVGEEGIGTELPFDFFPDLVEVAVQGGADEDAPPLGGEAAPEQEADDFAALADFGAVLVDDVAAVAEGGPLVGEELPEASAVFGLVHEVGLDPEDGVGVDEPPLEAVEGRGPRRRA